MNTAETTVSPELERCIQLVIFLGTRLLESGAESNLIRELMLRTSRIMGADDTEISLSSSSMVLTIYKKGKWTTLTSRCPERGVNMNIVTQLQQAVVHCERGDITRDEMEHRIKNVSSRRYPLWVTVPLIGLSCAVFSVLAGGDMPVFITTFVAASVGRIIFTLLSRDRFNPVIGSFAAAFVCTLLAGFAMLAHLGNEPETAVYSAVLMLVPGFPLVNSFSDMLKGFKNMGVARLVSATLLTLATALGILSAMGVLGI